MWHGSALRGWKHTILHDLGRSVMILAVPLSLINSCRFEISLYARPMHLSLLARQCSSNNNHSNGANASTFTWLTRSDIQQDPGKVLGVAELRTWPPSLNEAA